MHIESVTTRYSGYSPQRETNLEKSFDVKGDVLYTQLRVLGSCKYGKYNAVCCFENLKESWVVSGT